MRWIPNQTVRVQTLAVFAVFLVRQFTLTWPFSAQVDNWLLVCTGSNTAMTIASHPTAFRLRSVPMDFRGKERLLAVYVLMDHRVQTQTHVYFRKPCQCSESVDDLKNA